jgi:ATP synthase F1 gamma subunit
MSLQDVVQQREAMLAIRNLTGVFEGLASMRIAQVKSQVLESQRFFDELWGIYSQLRVDGLFRFGRTNKEAAIDKELFIIVTAEGGLSGDIDQKLIQMMSKEYDPRKQDIIVIGHHGAMQLIQQNIQFKKYFTLPSRDKNINIQPLVQEVRQYRETAVYYQTYVSLMVQDVKRLDLSRAVADKGQAVKKSKERITESNYIFEPSTYDVAAHLEQSMTQITLAQVILESKLAQYASRFRAMSVAKEKAGDMFQGSVTLYNRTKRRIHDERLKEVVNGLKNSKGQK